MARTPITMKKIIDNLYWIAKMEGFTQFKVVGYLQDPGHGYSHVYMFLIRFVGTKTYGLCIQNTQSGIFIEEPADLEDYDTTYQDITKKYSFKKV